MVWERLLVAMDSVWLLEDGHAVERYPADGVYEELRRAGMPMPPGEGPVELLIAPAAELVVLRAGTSLDDVHLLTEEACDVVMGWYRTAVNTVQPDEASALSPEQRELRDALEQLAAPTREMAAAAQWVYGSPAALVLDVGRSFVRGDQLRTVVGFSGAAAAAREMADRVYVEGYVLDTQRQAVPAAWAAVGEEVVAGPVAVAYFGVPLSEGFRKMVTRRSGAASVLHGQELDAWQLLRMGLPQGALVTPGRHGATR